ncbi:MAG TPA: lysine 5,6-aminomutase subunit alpha [Solirubrobacteraceae bacterium]|jgi:beta-lysine 5,6-aminomutase alpha subunit|nr:lysine 5,6-aminomutase subunit alpha [Solirubrobacteraceae bacterium]
MSSGGAHANGSGSGTGANGAHPTASGGPGKLDLDPGIVASCREAASQIAGQVADQIAGKTTVSVERTIARLLGVDGANELDAPLPNVLVDHVRDRGELDKGVAYWVGNALLADPQATPQSIAEAVDAGGLELCTLPPAAEGAIRERIAGECQGRVGEIGKRMHERRELRERLGEHPPPLRYVLTATGNVYEDVVHGLAVAQAGGDIVAVIRSTAQSLLDYVPYGPTTEGYGGTFATQENFRIMREALDEWSQKNGRYVRLSSFCSGLCMPEIAAMGAIEGFDNMVNDALYGILYRDINPIRGLIDQRVSRMINGYFGVVINTGEDNYLRTADAIEAAPSVTASQFINRQLALDSGVPDAQIAMGDAFEIDTPIPNSLLFEWAQAQLTRELFPDCPVKYMPPTRHMDGNLFRTHATDSLFNLITVATGQGIQTIGVPTEGIFTPHVHDRVIGLENVNYVFTAAQDLGEEIEFKRGGIIQTRAQEVLAGAHALLARIAEHGLFAALGEGVFGDVPRAIDEGRGSEGIVEVGEGYFNPTVEQMRGASSLA